MHRRSDWLERFAEYLKRSRTLPFVWGQRDCALFVCDAVLEMTGIDMAAAARGQYDSEETATAFLSACGGLEQYAYTIASDNGLDEIPLTLARRGDVVLWRQPEVGSTLGIVGLDGVYALFASPFGLGKQKVRNCTTAWRVG